MRFDIRSEPKSGVFLAGLMLVCMLLAPTFYQTGKTNILSLGYFSRIVHLSPEQAMGQSPPDGHPRTLWFKMVAAYYAESYLDVILLGNPEILLGDQNIAQLSALAYEALGEYDHALKIWKSTRNVIAISRVAQAAKAAGDMDLALEATRMVWEVDLVKGTSLLAGFLIKEKKDLRGAEAILRQGLNFVPVHTYRPYWWLSLAGVLEGQGRWGEAAEAYSNAIDESRYMYSSEKQLPRYYADMARAYSKNGQNPEAVRAIDAAFSLADSDQEHVDYVLQRAGPIYETVGLPEKALAIYQEQLLRNPKNESAMEAISRLASTMVEEP